MIKLNRAQREALEGVLGWSTIPASTLEYAAVLVEEAEDKIMKEVPNSTCKDELRDLGTKLGALCEAFGWRTAL